MCEGELHALRFGLPQLQRVRVFGGSVVGLLFVVRVAAAPTGVEDGCSEEERSGAGEGVKRAGEERALHECAVRVWGRKFEVGRTAVVTPSDWESK